MMRKMAEKGQLDEEQRQVNKFEEEQEEIPPPTGKKCGFFKKR